MADEIVVKICLLGDPAVGKTSLIRRFVLDQFSDNYLTTIGAKVLKKTVHIKTETADRDVTLMIWDLMGQKEYEFLQSTYYKGAQGALFVCDVTRKETLMNVRNWMNGMERITGKVPALLAANKYDLPDKKVTDKDIKEFSQDNSVDFFNTSAKSGDNVEAAFSKLASMISENVD
jgi:small GTP-binding protein